MVQVTADVNLINRVAKLARGTISCHGGANSYCTVVYSYAPVCVRRVEICLKHCCVVYFAVRFYFALHRCKVGRGAMSVRCTK